MEKVNPIGVTLDDIVFENRNKAYGAYALRQSYSDNILRATLAAPLLAIALFGSPLVINQLVDALLPASVTTITGCQLIEPGTKITEVFIVPDKPKPIASSAAPAITTVRNLPPVVTPDEAVNPNVQPARASQLQDAISGPLSIEGTPGEVPPIEFSTGEGEGAGNGIDLGTTDNTPFVTVEEMPEFPGGQAALLKFIGKYLRYPASAQQTGVSGVVYVSFVISPTGKVTDIEVLKGISADCDSEAVKVISKMPDWKPGRQSGRTVPVRYSLPIRFSIQ